RGASPGPLRPARIEETARWRPTDDRRRGADGAHPRARRTGPRPHPRAPTPPERAGGGQTRQRGVLRDGPAGAARCARGHPARRDRRDHRGLRPHHRARGQRSRLRMPGPAGMRGFLLPGVPGDGPGDDQSARWHLRLGHHARPCARGVGQPRRAFGGVMTSHATFRPALWVPGDWNAFFGFGTNIVVNMLVLTGLLRFVLGMPDELVFGRILPATGLMLLLSTMYYARLAYQLAAKTGRTDVCALPSGVSVPHMFVVVFVIMLPIATQT